LDRVLVLVTVGRFVLIPVVVITFAAQPVITAMALSLFVGLDIYDGILGRQRGGDGPSRRALDSIVDRLAIHTVYIALALKGFFLPELLAFMLLRDAYCAYQCSRIMRARWVAIRADGMYKLLNLSLAGWVVIAPFITRTLQEGLAILILSYSVVVAGDLTLAVRKVLALPHHFDCSVISAGALRRREATAGRFSR
jgi:phosphatidylglycerophosphate synthase